jgi:hypothetical protein
MLAGSHSYNSRRAATLSYAYPGGRTLLFALSSSWIECPPMPRAALVDQDQLVDRVLEALWEAITGGQLPVDEREYGYS